MIAAYKQQWEETMSKSEDTTKTRKRMSMKMGMLDPFGMGINIPKDKGGEIVPFLTKLSDDPALQGCCNFFLSSSRLIIGCDSQICDVFVRGVGIKDMMCEVLNKGDE